MVQTWQIAPSQAIRLDLNVSNLDDVARHFPDAYYSTFRTFEQGTRVLGLHGHLRRIYDPVSAPGVDELHLRRQLYVLLEPYRPGEARVRAVMTGQGQSYLALTPLTLLPRETYDKGVWVETTNLQRHQPRLKSTSFIGRSDAERKHLAEAGIFEALLVRDGYILEGMTSNFFYAAHQRASAAGRKALPAPPREAGLYTAGDDVLLGITRQTVIEAAQSRGIDVQYRPLALSRVAEIDEAFITSSTRGVVPVVQIDDITVGQGSPGPVTKELADAYEAYVVEHAENIL